MSSTQTTGKRVYIASKVNKMEKEVNSLKEKLLEMGHSIIYDWTQYPVEKPFADNVPTATVAADNMAKAVMNCDVLIVLCAEGGIGYHIETGGAMVASIILSYVTGKPQKEIYVVGEGNDRSVFYFHESVKRVDSVDELLKELSR